MIKYKVFKNPNEEEYKEITEAVELNEGYCPCLTLKSEDTKCMCKNFRDMEDADFCHCGRFYKVPQFEVLALVGDITNDDTEFDLWEDLFNKQNFIVIPIKYNANNIYHSSEQYLNLCKTKITKADAVFAIDGDSMWQIDIESWAMGIQKRLLHRSDLE